MRYYSIKVNGDEAMKISAKNTRHACDKALEHFNRTGQHRWINPLTDLSAVPCETPAQPAQ